ALERLGFGMRPSARLRPAAAEDDAVLDDDGADRGIGPGAAEPTPAESERQLHEPLIQRRIALCCWRGVAHFRALAVGLGSSSPESSASACSKSFGSRKLR